jgi:hypothetical protein
MIVTYTPSDGALAGVVADAISWIQSQLRTWYALPARIRAARERAARLADIATQRGKAKEAQRARDAAASLQSLDARHSQVSDRLRSLIGALGSVGVHLGAVPVVPVAVLGAAGVAAAMAYVMGQVKRQEDLISAVERGVLTPEEAEKLGLGRGRPWVSISIPWVPLLVAGGVAWLWLRRKGQA